MKKYKYDMISKSVSSQEMTVAEIEDRLLLAEEVCKAYDKYLNADKGEQSDIAEKELGEKFHIWFLQRHEDGR